MLKGALLAESLRVGAELIVPGLRVTRLSRVDVSASALSTQPGVWTFVEFEAEDEQAVPLAEALKGALLAEGGWYADFRVGDDHVVVFASRVFRYCRGDAGARCEVVAYGASVGVPAHQLDWAD
ncbi:MAG TPA: hypothetical protein VFW79_13730 [Cellulomonas sp.]|uniref:hypothetical protein n=1 Tax=Cellulomonas sp. TaxID=40001 RepID=UPI002E358684|nr:hypothetical protein [Cellulomonas sp.]HEX5333696.1 hypothetical protein [Cellulomonas sp.]